MSHYIALTIQGFEECVCRELFLLDPESSCSTLAHSVLLLGTTTSEVVNSLHSISSLSKLVTLIYLRNTSKRSIRLCIRDVLYMLRDKNIEISDILVKTNDKRTRRLIEIIAFRELKRVFKGISEGKRLWIIKIGNLMAFSLELTRRSYSRVWVTTTGLNPIVSFCIASDIVLNTGAKKVLEVFAGTATMALESCRMNASYCIGLDIDPRRLELSIMNARKYALTALYDPIVGDVHEPPFRSKVFDITLGDPPRGRRLCIDINYSKVLTELYRITKKNVILILDLNTYKEITDIIGRERIVYKDLIVGGMKLKLVIIKLI